MVNKVLSVVMLLGLGATGGWLLRDFQLQERQLQKPQLQAPAADLNRADQSKRASASPVQPEPDAPAEEPPARAIVPQPNSAAAPRPTAPPPANATEDQDVRAEFRALLAEGAFNEAMNLFVEVERIDSAAARDLKDLVLSYLQSALLSEDDSAVTGLVDAYLSRYYNDIDVLLVLARYHQQASYPTEAARTFQLAFAYALQPDERRRVESAFQSMVRELDEQLSRQERWQELVSFYETLELLDLTRPVYQLRQAELYLARGESELAQRLLMHLRDVASVSAQAEALLAGLQAPKMQSPPTDSVALTAMGDHYHLPLLLNRAAEVELIIDTGATTTTVSREAFERVSRYGGFAEVGPQVFNTANGVARGTVYRVDQVQLGGHTLSNVQLAVLDFDMPAGIDGLLGMNVLRQFRFQVDQDEQRLYLQARPQ